jgi:hypothetical protein
MMGNELVCAVVFITLRYFFALFNEVMAYE